MRIAFVSDLHYGIDGWVDRQVERFVETQVGAAACDLLLMAGDLAEMTGLTGADLGRNHRRLLARTKAAAGCPVAFIAGNHDLWTSDPTVDSWRVYREVLAEVAVQSGTTYLDAGNLSLGGLTAVGCYGHFDFSLRVPDLVIGGRPVTEEDYRRQTPPGYTAPVWMDGQNLHWEYDDPGACAAICAAGTTRLEAALAPPASRSIVLLSHGVPRHEANGHRESTDPISLFLNAFSGTTRLEAMVRRAVDTGAHVLSVSGHTHKSVARLSIDGADYLNVGGTYGASRLVMEEVPA